MGSKPKYSKEIQIKACKDSMSGAESFTSIAKGIGANSETVRVWYLLYQEHGEKAFDRSSGYRSYSKELKLTIINNYLSGAYSLLDLCIKYNISREVIRRWINRHYNGIEVKDYDPKMEVYTMKSRQTTFEERTKIVKWVLEHDMNYKEAASKYAVKYSLVYSWVKKYLKNGEHALGYNKRGPKPKSKLEVSNMNENDKLRIELELERTLRKQAEFRLEVHKKKEEIEKNLHFRRKGTK